MTPTTHHSAPAYAGKARSHGERDAREGKPQMTFAEAEQFALSRYIPTGMMRHGAATIYAYSYCEGYRSNHPE